MICIGIDESGKAYSYEYTVEDWIKDMSCPEAEERQKARTEMCRKMCEERGIEFDEGWSEEDEK